MCIVLFHKTSIQYRWNTIIFSAWFCWQWQDRWKRLPNWHYGFFILLCSSLTIWLATVFTCWLRSPLYKGVQFDDMWSWCITYTPPPLLLLLLAYKKSVTQKRSQISPKTTSSLSLYALVKVGGRRNALLVALLRFNKI